MTTHAFAAAPGPSGLEMLRHSNRAFRDPLSFLVRTARRHGDVVAFPTPGRRAFLVSDPLAARHVLQGNHINYTKQTLQYQTLSLVTGEGLLTSDGETWRERRRLIQPAFHRRTLDAVADISVTAGVRVIAEWVRLPTGSVTDIDAAMMRASLDVVGQSLFGTDLTGRDGSAGATPDALIGAVLVALDRVIARARWPLALPAPVPTPGNLRLARALRTLDGAVAEVVAGHRQSSGTRPGTEAHLLDLLLHVQSDGEQLTPAQVRDEIVTLIIAGHETVASALTWTWHLLGTHPSAAERLHDEVDDVLGGRRATAADLPRLIWTRQVIDEALRLFPPAWLVTRRAKEADEVGGFDIPAGSLVIVSPYVLHRHPAWWPEPDSFRPERFTAGFAPNGFALRREAYLPFGAGPRLCIGQDFALVEATLLLATIAQRFALRALPGARVRPAALVTIRPRDGLPMRIVHRAS